MYTERGEVRASVRARQRVRSFRCDRFILFAIVIFSASLAMADAAPATTRFNIETQEARKALALYARQARVQLGYAAEVVDDILTNPLNGEYENAQALALLLEGTGLEALYGESGITIRRIPEREAGGDIEERTPPVAHTNSLRFALASAAELHATVGQNQTSGRAGTDSGEGEERRPLEEIIVTGTLIRGAAPVGSPLYTLDREAIDLTGLATTTQIIQALPQNFGGSANETVQAAAAPVDGIGNRRLLGSSANLRGLGSDATLTLVNGRRVAPGGSLGGFVDVSMIPLTAVERIEILPDGVSALYGSDAIGGVVNFVLRDDFEGAETKFWHSTVTEGNQDKFQVGQVFGKHWNSGNFLVAYEYFNQDLLLREDRDYAATDDFRPFGGDDFRVDFTNPGTVLAGGETFAIPSNQDGTSLASGDLLPGTTNLAPRTEGGALFPSQERHSAFINASQFIAGDTKLFLQGQYSNREFETRSGAPTATLTVPSSNPFFVDPIGGLESVQVRYSFVDDLGPRVLVGESESYSVSGGIVSSLFTDWTAELVGTFAKNNDESTESTSNSAFFSEVLADSNPATAFNPFGDGSFTSPSTIDRIRGFTFAESDSTLWSIDAKVDGSLFEAPGGDTMVALGFQYREEKFNSDRSNFFSTTEPTMPDAAEYGRIIQAFFGEAVVPIFGEKNRVSGIERLAISAALRHERYDDVGPTTNPKFGVVWSPVVGLDFRASYGTSFKAPLLRELDDSVNNAVIFDFFDPGSPTGMSTILFLSGRNSNLTPEESTNWTVGFDFSPKAHDRFKFAATYFNVEFEGRIATVNGFEILNNQDQFASLVTRNPNSALTQSLFEGSPNATNIPGVGFDEIELILDARLANLAVVDVRGVDVSANYGFDLEGGDFDFSVSGSYLIDFEESASPESPVFETVDTVFDPASVKLRSSAVWSKDGLSAAAFVNHIGSYTDDFSDPERRIEAWTTVDLRIAYDFSEKENASWLNGVRASISAFNILDDDPPFVNVSNLGFDPANASAQGRVIAFEITKAW